jgi:hypothetical protein
VTAIDIHLRVQRVRKRQIRVERQRPLKRLLASLERGLADFRSIFSEESIDAGEPRPGRRVVGILLEARFEGTHIGEFEGVPATGRQVDVPYAVAYDLRGDGISALRLYFPLDLLKRQIAGAVQPAEQAV